MSKKNVLQLAAKPFASAEFVDVFTNISEEEIDATKEEFSEFMDTVMDELKGDEGGSTAEVYALFRKAFPIGSKNGEIAFLQFIRIFMDDLYSKATALQEGTPNLKELLDGLGIDPSELED